MINFAVGPVQMDEEIRAIGAEEVPYFRTPEFSAIMKENERLMKQFTGAPEDARAVFLTGSGTAAMEAAVMNLFTEREDVRSAWNAGCTVDIGDLRVDPDDTAYGFPENGAASCTGTRQL